MSRYWLWAAALIAAVAPAAPAMAHDWYPLECCHSMDCAPVDKVEIIQPALPAASSFVGTPAIAAPPSAMLVTSKNGTVLVPANFPRRESKDHRMHVCMRPLPPAERRTSGSGPSTPGDPGNMWLICIFMPPSM